MPDEAAPRERLRAFRELRIVELGTWIAAPTATALFADLGAEVIKIEPPAGDPGRRWFAAMGVAESEGEVQPTFALDNRRKCSMVLDLTVAADRLRLEEVLDTADAFVTNLRLSSLRKLDLDPDSLLAAHPRMVYGSVTGFGLRGPDAELPGYDVGAFWARSGLSHQLAGASPLHAPGGYGDHITGLAMFSAVLAGLYESQVTGRGGLVETSLLQAGTWIAGPDLAVLATLHRVSAAAPRHDAPTPLVNSYQTADGRWFFLTCIEAMRHLPAVCRAIGRPELVGDPRFADARSIRRHRRELIALLDEAFARAPLEEWAGRFEANGVWWQKVQTPDEILADPQVTANHWLEDVAVAGNRTVPMVTTPISVFGSREPTPARPPELAEPAQPVHPGCYTQPTERP